MSRCAYVVRVKKGRRHTTEKEGDRCSQLSVSLASFPIVFVLNKLPAGRERVAQYQD